MTSDLQDITTSQQGQASPVGPTTGETVHLLGDLEVNGKLRAAGAEALLAGALLLSDVQRESSGWNSSSQAKKSEERFRSALEVLREALS